MTDESSSRTAPARRLRFACACASAVPIASDPWVAVVNQGKLNDGTRELILNAIYRQPRTITQLAELLGISPPAVHRHVSALLADELIREVQVAPAERSWTVERYYQVSFPVVLASDRATLEPVLADLAAEIAEAVQRRQAALADALAQTRLSAQEEWSAVLPHYLYATAGRMARERLEAVGVLPPWPAHADGSRWVWWAEEAPHMQAAEMEVR